MSESLHFHPQVPKDIAEAIGWYDKISPDLANSFRLRLQQAFAKIREQPSVYAVMFDDVRVLRLTRFPYLVHYRLSAQTPLVLAVFHSASSPEKWRERAKQ